MKKTILLAAALLIGATSFAQYKYDFTVVKENPATRVKDQARTGTCWCFATVSFLESEAIRKGTADTSLNLSEMYLVRSAYLDRAADDYFRRGRGNLGPGAVGHTATFAMQRSGLMTEQAYNGINYDSKFHNHGKLQAEIDSVMRVAVKEKKGVPYNALNAALDKWLGKVPETSEFKGENLTPQQLREKLKLDASEYVEITSFSHHPFYEKIRVEWPDNYEHELYYNVPIDELVEVMDYAIEKGFTIGWAADMSETYFAHNRGLALFTPGENLKATDSYPARFVETPVDQDVRQAMFDDFTTSDDHLMHITGISKDQEGAKYYIVKNSWGPNNGEYKGWFNASVNYVKAKTIAIMIHKDAVPKELKKKLGIK